jgi:phosphopantothenoylcysteine decarboxylase / phosphopantothenate---cysteine ligase
VSDFGAMRLILGVSGGVAAYKSVELVRRLREHGAQVQVVMTRSARRFVGEATFQAVSGQPVRSSLWDASAEAAMGHIELARWATRILIAPASANTIARLALGLADDLLGTLCLASRAPLSIAPAMNQQMWAHPAVQAHLRTLAERGVEVLGPASGAQACGDVGPGRMLEPAAIIEQLTRAGTALAGWRIVVSAGPTLEDLDPVRFLGNRSSGRMGFAIAAEAAAQGAAVTLIAGPVNLETPAGCRRVDVRSALEMRDAVLAEAAAADVYIGAAAVADYRPLTLATEKIKKAGEHATIELVRNPDIIAELAAHPRRPFLVGFAAETRDVLAYARGKLEAKGLDLVCANRVGEGLAFDQSDNALTVIGRDFERELGHASKAELARRLLALIREVRTESHR